MFKKIFNVIFAISGAIASFWKVFIKFCWHGQKLAVCISIVSNLMTWFSFHPRCIVLRNQTQMTRAVALIMLPIAFIIASFMSIPLMLHSQVNAQYARHYNPRFVYFLPTFWRSKTFFQGGFFRKFCLYVWLVFKSGL